jgi:pimeloyl-ACP methyl ester carboxylesterase
MKHLLVILVLLWGGSIQAGEVKLRHGDLTLNANLEKASGNWPAGPVVLLTHGTLAHNGMEIITALQQLLVENDVSSLALNLGLGLDDRHGMYDCKTPHTHHHTDALDEIGQWLAWLKEQGVENVVLLGHSRGGNQTAWFAAERDDPVIKKIVLVAPQAWDKDEDAAGYEKRYAKPLAPVLAQANELVAKNKGDTLLEKVDFIYCDGTSATASAVVSYYNPEPRLDTVYLLPKIGKPLLVFVGSEDKVSQGLADKVAPMAEKPGVELVVIDGADHYFRDLYAEDLVDQVIEFITN